LAPLRLETDFAGDYSWIDGERLLGDVLGLGIFIVACLTEAGDDYKCLSKGYD
jgi:hypothetical protein